MEIILFIITAVFAFMLYYVFAIRKEYNRVFGIREYKKQLDDKNLSDKKRVKYEKLIIKLRKQKMPSDIMYIVNRYKIDVDKINYARFLNIIGVINALFLSIVISLVLMIDNLVLQFTIGFVLFMVLILFVYHLIGIRYKKGDK